MKKVLLASTALVFTAGMAAAEVSLSGYAEIGVGGTDAPDSERFHHDLDVTFTMSGETDGGLTFGATIDLDEVSNGIGPNDGLTSGNPGSVFVSGDFGTITMGDTDGAFDWAMTEVVWGTTIADDHSSHAGYNGNSGLDGGGNAQVARYNYSFGDFAFAISAEKAAEDILGLGVKYSGDLGGVTLGVGVGFQSGSYKFGLNSALQSSVGLAALPAGATRSASLTGEADIAGLSVSADFAGGFSVVLNYSNLDGSFTGSSVTQTNANGIILTPVIPGGPTAAAPWAVDWDHYGIGVAYAMDALLVEANYGKYDATVNGAAIEADGFGLSVNYDLGGGAKVAVGYGSGTSFGNTTSSDTWSAGLVLSF